MPHVEWRRLGRVAMYGSLTCGLGLAMLAPGTGARPSGVNETWPRLGRKIVTKYLESLPADVPQEALQELEGLSPASLKRVLDWLPVAVEQRPLTLVDTGLAREGTLFAALLEASLTGFGAPALGELPRLVQQLPLAPEEPLRLPLLMACARRAAVENATGVELELLAAAARHPQAGWGEIGILVESAIEARDTAAALEVLQDWLDDPPERMAASEPARARGAMARLLLVDHQTARAWAVLQPLLAAENALAPELLEVAWSAAAAAGQTASLVGPLEAALREQPLQQKHWRELADAPAAEADYLTGLRRLATACLAAGQEQRALEMHLHLAWLESPRHLLPVLPMAIQNERIEEVVDLLDRLDEERPDLAGARVYTLALECLEQGQTESARHLLEARLARQPQDLASTRLLLRWRASNLPPVQAVLLWKQHLRRHPSDPEAHLAIAALWQQAGQPRAAVNHLLALPVTVFHSALRQQLAAAAIQARHAIALQVALERLRAAGETLAPELVEAGEELLMLSRRQASRD